MNKLKSLIRKAVTVSLIWPVKIVLFRKHPQIIAITGSAGKTTCKELLGQLLAPEYNVLVPADGYNTEIGAPLALFDEKTPANLGAIFSWIAIIARIYAKAIFSNKFPQIVIIEMGADTPGDIRYLAKLFQPQVGVVLEVLPVHLVNFKNVEEIAAEKAELVKAIPKTGQVYLNFDNPLVRDMAGATKAPVAYFGTGKVTNGVVAAKLRAGLDGLDFSIIEGKNKYAFHANIYGAHMIYPLLGALMVAHGRGISWAKLTEKTKFIQPFKGRMNIIEGLKGSTIIDDSYNANPKSTIEALHFLSEQKGRRIAMLGSMNELGDYEEEGHKLVGVEAAKCADYIFTVGKPAATYLLPASLKSGFDEVKTKAFKDSTAAGEYVAKLLQKGDIVLAKGSQNNVRMERAVSKLMLHPELAAKLLVRQSEFWESN